MARGNLSSYPLEPSQLLSPSTYRRGEPTGMIFCPRRFSNIGVMRCGEYQERDRCALGCPSAAPAEAVEALRLLTKPIDPERVGKRSYICSQCNGEKKSYYTEICKSCGINRTAAAQAGRKSRALQRASET